ncbi:MAG: LysR substrate-binding domain-containing protein [Methyloligellaceae bacterium]
MITIRQLQYFEILSRHLHFGRASEECAVSQPALSMQIKELETELDITLVERGKSGITLTREGEEILERTRGILRSVQDLKYCVKQDDAPLSGTLILGVIPTIAPYLLPKALPKLKELYPDLSLKLRESQTSRLVEELKNGRIDAVLLALPVDCDELVSMELFTDSFLLVAGKDVKATDPYQVMQEQDLLLLEEGHCLRDQVLKFCREKKPEALSSFGATSLTTITQMVANGFGTTLLPEIACEVELNSASKLTSLRFPEPQPQRRIGLMWRKSSPRSKDYEELGLLLRSIAGDIVG